MPVAVGTSLLIIAINSAASVAARAGSLTLHWSVIIPFTAAAIAGSLGGKHVADKVPGTTLTKAFAALLFAVAAYVAIRSSIALATSTVAPWPGGRGEDLTSSVVWTMSKEL